jgi:predicted O-methyltransferase YrrM
MDINCTFEDFEADSMALIFDEIKEVSEMSVEESLFLNGLLRYYRPTKVLEVGVAAGASSCVLLNAITQNENAALYSVDIATEYYQDHKKLSGWKAKELFPDARQWDLKLGVDISEVINEIGSGIDFVLLDTVHVHPAETISFLSIFPYLKKDAIVVLHDINLFYSRHFQDYFATKYLFDHITADKVTLKRFEKDYIHPNIGAFKINNDTTKYISDVIRSLFLPWSFIIPEKIINATGKIVKAKYSEEDYLLFTKAINQAQNLQHGNGLRLFLKCLYHLVPTCIMSFIKYVNRKFWCRNK